MSAHPARRLQVVAAAATDDRPAIVPTSPDSTDRYTSQLPGLGGRFVASLADEAGRLGWTAVETAGLLAAAEERCALWILTGRRLHREPRVCRWRNGRLTDAEGGLEALAAAAAGAPARTSVCLAAVSGRRRPPRSIISTLARSGARIGRVTGGVADELEVAWAVEVLIAPALAPRGMAGLRERIAAAPRCAWCRIPVLGSSCPRCREAAT